MSREKKRVTTAYGPATVELVACETCGTEMANEDTYTPLNGWFKITQGEDSKNSTYRKRIESDFCSVDCLVGALVPDIYSTDPTAVLRAVANLKRIEKDLDDPRKGLPTK